MEGLSQQIAHEGDLSESPTATPYQTRSSSPIHGSSVAHTKVEGSAAMVGIWSIWRSRQSSHAAVSVVDGSATVPAMTKFKYLAVYFAFNLAVTLYNKAVMIQYFAMIFLPQGARISRMSDYSSYEKRLKTAREAAWKLLFPFPFLLTALHATSSRIGTNILLSRGHFTLVQLTGSNRYTLYFFSFLYTANIAISNLSLSLTTIPLHQSLRATTPLFTILLYRLSLFATYPRSTYLSPLPLLAGVALATYGDYRATLLGTLLTLLGAFLAALKTVATNRLQTAGLHFGALELLYRMSLLALCHSLVWACLNGEVAAFYTYTFTSNNLRLRDLAGLLINGALAFGLNIISFSANKRVGALTMTVAALLKQTLTILLSVFFWRLDVGVVNAFGIVLTLVGGALYAYVGVGPARGREGIAGAGAEVEEGMGGR